MRIARLGFVLAVASGGAWLGTMAGCVGDTAVPPAADAGSDAVVDTGSVLDTGSDSNPIDAPADAVQDTGPIDAGPRCDPTKPFDPPVNEGAPVNSAQEEDSARLSPNGLELFLTRDDLVGKRIYRYSRKDLNATWDPPTVEAALSLTPPSPPASAYLALDPSALTAYLSALTGAGPWQIYGSSRNSVGAVWSPPAAVVGISTAGATDEQPWINPAGNRLYFMSNRSGGVYHIWVATKSGAFSAPVRLDPNLATEDRWPVLSDDELTLYYGAYEGTNGLRVYKRTRASIGGTWSVGVPEASLNGTGLNSGSRTFPTSLSSDTCEIYIASNRAAGSKGAHDVWHARKPK